MSNQNDNFDFILFAVEAIKIIDTMRSYQKNSIVPTESRINCFYRILGLPAVLPKNERDFDLRDGQPDDFNNGNISILDFSTYNFDLGERQDLYAEKIAPGEIVDFVDKNVQNLKSGLSKDSKPIRKRGVLFPMVVDGKIHVYPSNRRVGGAFMTTKELRHSTETYKRPLIETILRIKLRGQNISDTQKGKSVSNDFNSPEFKMVNENALNRLNKTLNTVAWTIEKIVRDINSVRNELGGNVYPTVENIPMQNHNVADYEYRSGALDIMSDNQNYSEITYNSVLSLFEFDDTAGGTTRNIHGGDLASMFVEMLVPNKNIKRNSDILDRRISKAKLELKKLFRDLDLILGTFGAISGVDILAVISALYRLEPEYLVGLLNKESQDRLKREKGNIPALQNARGLSESIKKLQAEVIKIFDELSGYIVLIKHEDKIRNQNHKRETK